MRSRRTRSWVDAMRTVVASGGRRKPRLGPTLYGAKGGARFAVRDAEKAGLAASRDGTREVRRPSDGCATDHAEAIGIRYRLTACMACE
jgi:hypothetical protein